MINNQNDLARNVILGSEKWRNDEIEQDIKTYSIENKETGVPLYWQTVLLNSNRIKILVKNQDINILSFLTEINVLDAKENVFK